MHTYTIPFISASTSKNSEKQRGINLHDKPKCSSIQFSITAHKKTISEYPSALFILFMGRKGMTKEEDMKQGKETEVEGHKEKLLKCTEYRNQQRKIVRESGKMEQE